MLSSSSVSNVDNNGESDSLTEDSITKKVCFKESNVNLEDVMVVEDSNTKKGSWVIFGHYLTVQPWKIDFNPSLPYPNMVLTWIQFPGLPSHLYQKQILIEIGGMCGCYGHIKENCPSVTHSSEMKEKGETLEQNFSTSVVVGDGDYGPWMLVERRSRRGTLDEIKKDHVKMYTPISIQKQAEHVVHFNPIFEESSFVNVEVKEGVLEAKNNSAVVLKKRSILEPVREEIGGSICPTEIKFPRVVLKGQNTNAKVTSSKEGWKLNKTLKGLSNRFKNSENTRVYFVDSMKRAAELIASEIDENSAKDLSQRKGEREEFSSTGHH
ncbi:hypothetical protein GOBAR_DD02700 [Gossypium barbadense]|nr:hypothetical protein GOBAR_DD02700 [Gossypium barbadense]